MDDLPVSLNFQNTSRLESSCERPSALCYSFALRNWTLLSWLRGMTQEHDSRLQQGSLQLLLYHALLQSLQLPLPHPFSSRRARRL